MKMKCRHCGTVETHGYVGKIEDRDIYIYECQFCYNLNGSGVKVS